MKKLTTLFLVIQTLLGFAQTSNPIISPATTYGLSRSADFTAMPTTVCAGDSVQFTNISTGNPSSFQWTFYGGAPRVSSDTNPIVIYNISGIYDVKLVTTTANGKDSVIKSSYITVLAKPTVSIGSFADVCQGVTSVSLNNGFPTGGTYSGTAVTGSTFNPSVAGAGTHSIYYTITDSNQCNATDSSTIKVSAGTQYYARAATACEGDSIFSLPAGTPRGGVYSGTGVVNGTLFDPQISGAGTFMISYVDTADSCAMPGFASVNVTVVPVVKLDPFRTICLAGGPLNLTGGTPIGGTYSGIGITNNILDPTINGAGNILITYTVTNWGCTGADSQMVEIGVSKPIIENITNQYCINDYSVVLEGDPLGGIFSGSGITDSLFDPNMAGVGLHTITYVVTGACAGTASYDIAINAKPTIGPISGPIVSSQNRVTAYSVVAQNGAFYYWNLTGGNIISSANNQVSVLWDTTSVGNLEAIINDQNSCRDTTNITVDLWPVGIEKVNTQTISYFPNPVSNSISFSGLITETGTLEIRVFNLLGQQVRTYSEFINTTDIHVAMNVSNLTSGTYFYQLLLNGSLIGNGQFAKQ